MLDDYQARGVTITGAAPGEAADFAVVKVRVSMFCKRTPGRRWRLVARFDGVPRQCDFGPAEARRYRRKWGD
jgi:hypothetical protein